MKNKSLSDEKERILKEHNAQAAICDTLARERHSAIEGEAKAKEALAALKDQTRQVVVFCKYYQTKHKEVTDQLAGSNEEIARVKSVNEAFARLSFQHTGTCAAEEGSESAGKDLAAGEMKFKQIGSFTVPEALSNALEQTVMKDLSDSFEERLAQVMLHQMAERPKYEKEIANYIQYEGSSSTSPALSPTLARSSIAMPVTPSSPLSPLVRRSVPPSNAHPPTPPAEHILASSLSRIRTLSSTEVSQPSRPSADAEHITPDTPQTTPSLPIPRHALPTPTPVASAPSSSTCSPDEEDLFTKIKQEDAGVIVPNWPWKRGEIIDLTEYLDDADEPVDTPQIDLRELEMELNAALTETDSPEPAEKTPISDAPTVGSEKKRTLEDDQLDGGDDPARKRMRVDDVQDVEMADGGQGDIDRPSDDSSGLVGGPFEGVADTTDHVMGPPATHQQPEVLQISTGSVPNGDVSRTVADDGLLANKAPVGVEPTTEILATTGAHTPLRISNSLRSTAEAEADDRSYCHCKKPPCGVMIACDDPGCAIEWVGIMLLLSKFKRLTSHT
ncbi:hypothetical protein EW026_g628 [Hermanssonia centrifuga]|uniref:Uncharacterized protein n=1 Tax=Hermanssonia centrifuga TaxID=98765 RepID=A0A4S4KU27_9APHY|nr:hypothetical protein EW026_g628 [Hermanssonia centrifuga]